MFEYHGWAVVRGEEPETDEMNLRPIVGGLSWLAGEFNDGSGMTAGKYGPVPFYASLHCRPRASASTCTSPVRFLPPVESLCVLPARNPAWRSGRPWCSWHSSR